MIAFNLLHLKA